MPETSLYGYSQTSRAPETLMAKVKTFRIHSEKGVPDKEIREWLTECEETEVVNVQTVFIPAIGKYDARLTVIVTHYDDRT